MTNPAPPPDKQPDPVKESLKSPPDRCPHCQSPDRVPSLTQIGIEDWRCQQCHRFLAWIKHPFFTHKRHA